MTFVLMADKYISVLVAQIFHNDLVFDHHRSTTVVNQLFLGFPVFSLIFFKFEK
jgi:hypothetical protein